MALTFEQIDNLKEGDPLLLAVTMVQKIGHCTFKVKTSKDSCVAVSSMLLSLPPEKPKYDSTRLFKKGDRAQVVERNGRTPTCFPVGRIKVGDIVTVAENEDGDVFIKVLTKYGHEMMVPWFMLELVTPVEERMPYHIKKAAEFDAWFICNRNNDVIFHFNPDPCNQMMDMAEIEKLAREECDYLNERFRDLIGKAAAEAECERLNAEWRKKVGTEVSCSEGERRCCDE